MKAWNQDGLKGIQIQKKPGRPPKLTKEEQEEVCETVLESPRDAGFKYNNWKLSMMSTYIEHEFDKHMSLGAISKMLDRHGIVRLKPRTMLAKGDPKKKRIQTTHEEFIQDPEGWIGDSFSR